MLTFARTWCGVPLEELPPADRAEADAHFVRYGLSVINWRQLYATAGVATAQLY